jgi:tetratricopeptide (TPR) repeat protein
MSLALPTLAPAQQPPDVMRERPTRPSDPRAASTNGAASARAAAALDAGIAALDAGRYQQAIKLLDDAYRLDPEHQQQNLAFRAHAKRHLGDCRGAIADYDLAEEPFPFSEVAAGLGIYLGRAECRSTLGDAEAAVDDLEKHVTLSPDDAHGWSLLGDYRGAAGHYADAVAAFRKSIELDAGNAYVHYRLGATSILLDRQQDALSELREAVRLDPALTEAKEVLAALEREMRSPVAATAPTSPAAGARAAPAPKPAAARPAAAVPPAITYAPVDPRSALGRGIALYREKDFQPALQQLLAATAAAPNDARGWVFLADTYRWLGLERDGESALATAKKLDPNALNALR